jgi:CRP-like cAMP-binding protein
MKGAAVAKQILQPLIDKIASTISLQNDEIEALESLPVRTVEFAKGDPIVRVGDRPRHSFVVLSGITCALKYSGAGGRQILMFHVATDIPDLQSIHLNTLDFGVAAAGASRMGFMLHRDLRNMCHRFPRLADALWRITLVDAAIFREWELNLGQRDGYTRVAHFFCELAARMKLAGLGDDSFSVPLTQQEIGDATGMTSVHVNRIERELRSAKLSEFKRGRLTVLDWAGLREAGDFDPAYLHLTPSQERLLAA